MAIEKGIRIPGSALSAVNLRSFLAKDARIVRVDLVTPFAPAEGRTQLEVKMEFLWQVTWAVFIGIVMLIIEYFLIQPRQNARNLSVLKALPEVDESWTIAIQKGLREFRKHQGHSWLPFFGQKIKIEESVINEESAFVTVRVEPRTPVVFLESLLYKHMKVDGITQHHGALHRLVIGRLGDIQEISLLEESTIRYTVQRQGVDNTKAKRGIQRPKVNEPVTRLVDGKFEIEIPFVVENTGTARTVHPNVTYKVAQLIGGKFEEKTVESSKDWTVHLKQNSVNPLRFTASFDEANIVLLKDPPHRISVRIFSAKNVS